MPRSISSPVSAELKRLRLLLKDPAARREQGLAVAEGPRLLGEALRAGLVRTVWATPEALGKADAELKGLLARRSLRPALVEAVRLKDLSDTREPQGWLFEVERRAPAVPAGASLYLALDTLQDPGNLGTLLRLAWAVQAAVLLGPGCADPWSPKVLRAGAGAQFHAAFSETADLGEALRELAGRGVRLYATDPRAEENYLQADARAPHCWVLGSEGQGLGKEIAALCRSRFRIAYPGGAESLNVAVSGSILLFETLRQRS